MKNWVDIATERFSQKRQNGTSITPESTLLGVLEVHSTSIFEKEGANSPVHSGDTPKSSQWTDLLMTAMRACDFFGDTDRARHQMLAELREIPTKEWADLILHFRSTYPSHRHEQNQGGEW